MSNTTILPGQTIGIIGGGQLGRMMALAAKANGFRIAVLDPAEDSPCGQVADIKIIGEYGHLDSIKKLADVSDVVTYEFENISAEALEWLCANAHVPQGSEVLEITQDRTKEKTAIQKAGCVVAPYAVITTEKDIYDNIEKLGYPAVLKTSRGGYDGKGQVVIKSGQDIKKAAELLDNGVCVLEKWIAFEKEISVIICRNISGEKAVFPVGENVHKENILHQTIVPAMITADAEERAVKAANQLAEALSLVGTLAVEMFLTKDGQIYINELAPRPHNSGHYSIEACETSQFEQHIRAVCNWPLGSTELLKPAVMVNILGEHQEPLIKKIPELDDWKIHLYGKKDAKYKRKMGHVTLLRNSAEEAIEEAEKSGIWTPVKEKIGG
ncbi:5-(carboxyamino)imidazole ribonucleotide synthase [Cytobacillus firmus]|uniref:N5-carboxyaminoimidazole ribonucleotide synthase n=1 Tax=Cytobacillus firmus TaxID=1399 RepID=A0AA46SGG8_CYTFI|nr:MULTISPECIES: 5-(carboxyamino)imidazole ribonucleotide synthase [Cytobacillus]KML40139.1 phosphoribosylaminoimidazole carboxylase [Cytobacillus firmus]MCC3649608.1 5-(carboxyamino)imidazole ribonucleotide synthase [Cytobacillus oceanisediminis]MCU1808372.1 5-(carboxyamino)imidazole ribonucleotide synthase [Cytobacillus firmus]UYG97778.1 5-(carboxyamino)imidazole ribonucleotide synthase [Cytobacillus firmus]